MSRSLCNRFNFDDAMVADRLSLIGLTGTRNHDLATLLLTKVIQPNIDSIVDEIYAELGQHPEFKRIVPTSSRLAALKLTQRQYLLSLGHDYESREYFENRLRVGSAHQSAGVSLGLYQCFFCRMQLLLIDAIPPALRRNAETYSSLVNFIVKITSLDLSLAIETYYSEKIVSLERSLETSRNLGQELRQFLRMDPLTKTRSRAFVLKLLRQAIAQAKTNQRPLSVVMADLDHFKEINDQHGHLLGDRILRSVATRMAKGAREHDTIGRYGGEEFMLILEDTSLSDAITVSERMRQHVGTSPVHEKEVMIPVTISVGVAQLRPDDNSESLISRADQALYVAKQAGRNRVCSERDLISLHRVGSY